MTNSPTQRAAHFLIITQNLWHKYEMKLEINSALGGDGVTYSIANTLSEIRDALRYESPDAVLTDTLVIDTKGVAIPIWRLVKKYAKRNTPIRKTELLSFSFRYLPRKWNRARLLQLASSKLKKSGAQRREEVLVES